MGRAELRAEVNSEVISCESLKGELQKRVSTMDYMQRELDGNTPQMLAEIQQPMGFIGCSSLTSVGSLQAGITQGVSTPQLEEFDAYEELVKRLQAELQFERKERESLDSSLATLRSSYQLLLGRAPSCAAAAGAKANVRH